MDWWKAKLDPLLLATIARAPRHGYAIISELRERSDGAFDLAEGTVYPALHRLERDGSIASDLQFVDGRRRRTYRVTAAGHAALQEQRREWHVFARGFDAVLETIALVTISHLRFGAA